MKHITMSHFIEMAALAEASQLSEQGKVNHFCVITCIYRLQKFDDGMLYVNNRIFI